MKGIYILLLFAFLHTAKGQDYCSRIKKEAFDDKITFEYTSPYDINEKPPVRVTRTYNVDPEFVYDNFNINFRVEGSIDSVYVKNTEGGQTEKSESGLIVEFDDKSKVTDEAATINHDVSDDHTLAVWYLDYALSDDQVKTFGSKKIVKFSLAGHTQLLPDDSASSVMHYVQCIKDAKKKK